MKTVCFILRSSCVLCRNRIHPTLLPHYLFLSTLFFFNHVCALQNRFYCTCCRRSLKYLTSKKTENYLANISNQTMQNSKRSLSFTKSAIKMQCIFKTNIGRGWPKKGSSLQLFGMLRRRFIAGVWSFDNKSGYTWEHMEKDSSHFSETILLCLYIEMGGIICLVQFVLTIEAKMLDKQRRWKTVNFLGVPFIKVP